MIQLCVGLLFLFVSQLGVQPAIYGPHLTPENSSRLAWCHPSARSSDLGQGWNYGYDKGGRLESVEQNGTASSLSGLFSYESGDQVRFLVSTAAFVDGFGNRSLGFDSGTVDWPGDDGILFDETAPRLEEICAQAGILKVTFSEPVSAGLAAGTITIDGASPSWSLENGGYTLSLSLSDGQHVIDIGTGALDLAGYGVSQAAHQSFNIDTTTTKSIFSAPFPGEVGDSLVGNPYGFQGLPQDSETGFLYVRNRYYDPELGRFITPDPMGYADGPNQYQFALNDPIVNRDPSGNIVETAWDVLNIGMGIYSGYQNIKAGNYGLAAFDALGVVVDTVAALVPFVPGGVGASLKAARCGQAFQKAQLVVRTADVAQGAGGAALAHIEGNDGEAAFNASMAALGAGGLFRKNPCNCLVAGTPISTAGGEKPVEAIEVGDEVWAQNSENGQAELAKVVGLFQKEAPGVLRLHLSEIDGRSDVLEVTPQHPVFEVDRGWTTAGDLQVGDHLRDLSGRPVSVQTVEWTSGAVQVYNFEVEGLHSYFAGKAKVLVHNCARYVYDPKIKRYRDLSNGRLIKQRDLPYPGDNGFVRGTEHFVDLKRGTVIGRFGSFEGRFMAAIGHTSSELGMPPGSEFLPMARLKVMKTFKIEAGEIAGVPEFAASGGATQYFTRSRNIQDLINSGILKVLP